MTEPDPQLFVSIARGNVYLPRETYDTYFSTIEAAALLPHPEGILLLPLIQDSAGGSLIKIRNSRGDRVIHAQEFYRINGYAEQLPEIRHTVKWLSEKAALLIENVQK